MGEGVDGVSVGPVGSVEWSRGVFVEMGQSGGQQSVVDDGQVLTAKLDEDVGVIVGADVR